MQLRDLVLAAFHAYICTMDELNRRDLLIGVVTTATAAVLPVAADDEEELLGEPQYACEPDWECSREFFRGHNYGSMSGRNCKLIVVKPERRGGYMPSPVMTSALKEAKRRGIPIDERIHAP